jgi:hypothetical protein
MCSLIAAVKETNFKNCKLARKFTLAISGFSTNSFLHEISCSTQWPQKVLFDNISLSTDPVVPDWAFAPTFPLAGLLDQNVCTQTPTLFQL